MNFCLNQDEHKSFGGIYGENLRHKISAQLGKNRSSRKKLKSEDCITDSTEVDCGCFDCLAIHSPFSSCRIVICRGDLFPSPICTFSPFLWSRGVFLVRSLSWWDSDCRSCNKRSDVSIADFILE